MPERKFNHFQDRSEDFSRTPDALATDPRGAYFPSTTGSSRTVMSVEGPTRTTPFG
jgi:hypothetical protein